MKLISHLFISELLPIIDVFARAPRTSPITTDTSQLWIRSFTSSHNIHNQNQFPFAPSAWSWRRYRPPPWTWTSLSRGGYSWLEKKIVGGSEKMRHHREFIAMAVPCLRLADWRAKANKLIGTRKVRWRGQVGQNKSFMFARRLRRPAYACMTSRSNYLPVPSTDSQH